MLHFNPALGVQAQNGGLFVAASANWRHPERKLTSYELIFFVKEGVLYLTEAGVEFEVRPGEACCYGPSDYIVAIVAPA